MATTSIETRPAVAPNIRATLDRLRIRVRAYIWVEGIASALTWLGLAFWASLAIDWFFEPPREARIVIFAAVAMVFVGILLKLIGARAFVPLSDSSMATVLERRFAKFDDALLTAVMLGERDLNPQQCNLQMLAHTCQEASGLVDDVRLGKVFNPVPLRRSGGGAAALALSIGLFAVFCPEAMGIWAQRNLLFSPSLWPRQSRLEIGAPFENGVAKVAKGADLPIVVRADTQQPRVPQVVELRYRTEGGARNRVSMNREGAATSADAFQEYSYTFQGVLSPIRFDVIDPGPSGDRIYDLRIEVVDTPTITRMDLDCQFPKYTDRSPRTLPVTGAMQLPLGSHVTVRAVTNKPLVKVQVDSSRGEQAAPPAILKSDQLAADRQGFAYTVDSLDGDTTLLFTLFDVDGIRSREPVRLVLAATPDEPPQLRVRLDGIGTAITTKARLPLVGEITDDYGIDRLLVETSVDQKPASERPLMTLAQHPAVFDLPADAAVEVGDLQLAAGQKLLVTVKAADRFDLGGKGPNVGTSERWLLDVVTPEQLRAMLEARELVLRQRFEVIINEVTETRDLLLKVTFNPADEKKADSKEAAEPEDKAGKPEDKAGKPARSGSDEPGDTPRAAEKEMTPEKHRELQTMRVERALQNARKNTHETAGVAESFDDIRKQLVNNRIDTEELKLRIDGGIAKPLHHVADDMFPVLQQQLERLAESLGDIERGPQRREEARKQADAIVVAMRHVLDRMIELEDFNEAVTMLRQIIERQQQLDAETKERQKQKLRNLKED